MSLPTDATSQELWSTQGAPAGASVALRFRLGTEVRRVILPLQTLHIGSSSEQDLILPPAWTEPQHLIIEYDAGIARIRTARSSARALLGDTPITTSGLMLPPGAVVTIPSNTGPVITLECEFDAHHGVMLIDHSSKRDSAIAPVEIAALSPLDEIKSVFATSPTTPPQSLSPRKPFSRQAVALWGVGIAIGIVVTSLYWNDVRRAFWGSSVNRDFSQVIQDTAQARTLLHQGEYVEAKSLIDDATRIASRHPAFVDQLRLLHWLSTSPEIKLGGIGYVHMDKQWLPPEMASAWKSARVRDDPQINSLFTQAKSALAANGDLQGAEQSCDQALSLMNTEPVHPHPMQQRVVDLRNQIHDRLIAQAMTARGYVLYNNRWITPADRFRLQQDAKGLAFYKGKWISKSAAFIAEQTDRGLVLYKGRWVTPDDVKRAQGFVKFEGAWITPQLKTEILGQRQAAAELQQQRAEQTRIAAVEKAEEKRRENEAIQGKFPDAYLKSQDFVRDILKSPASAQFQPFGSPKVKVTYADGWYTVIASVDAQNSFGVLLRSNYFCKLKPVGGDQWQAGTTYLMDN